MNEYLMVGATRSISIEEAVQMMKEKIAAGENNLERQQVELALSVKLKTEGTVISDEGISALANAIRLVAEVSLYGSERADKTETMVVTSGEIAAILQGSAREEK